MSSTSGLREWLVAHWHLGWSLLLAHFDVLKAAVFLVDMNQQSIPLKQREHGFAR